MSRQGRGQLTARIQAASLERLGYQMESHHELRLMAYVMYVMVNDQRIDPGKCGPEDRKILSKWRNAGHIEGGASGLAITRDFWDIICHLVFLGYVDRYEEGERDDV